MDTNRDRHTFTAADVESMSADVEGLRKVLRLLNSGPGGIGQLRRVTKERLTAAETRLALAVTNVEGA